MSKETEQTVVTLLFCLTSLMGIFTVSAGWRFHDNVCCIVGMGFVMLSLLEYVLWCLEQRTKGEENE